MDVVVKYLYIDYSRNIFNFTTLNLDNISNSGSRQEEATIMLNFNKLFGSYYFKYKVNIEPVVCDDSITFFTDSEFNQDLTWFSFIYSRENTKL